MREPGPGSPKDETSYRRQGIGRRGRCVTTKDSGRETDVYLRADLNIYHGEGGKEESRSGDKEKKGEEIQKVRR